VSLVIVSRKSPLALWQAEHVRDRLHALHPGRPLEIHGMTTAGDRSLDTPLARIGGKGLFVKELEEQLLAGRAAMAVHSLKDVTVDLPPGLCLGAILARADVRDALVSPAYAGIAVLPPGARVGTASLRRRCLLGQSRPDLRVEEVRGNVGTRLKRLDAGEFDALLLAAAGLERLGLQERIRAYLPVAEFLPAIGQGALGIECRIADAETLRLIAPLHDPATAACVRAERAFNRRLGGSCQIPVAGHAHWVGENISLQVRIFGRQGTVLVGERAGPAAAPEALGEAVAEKVLARGARALLNEWL